MPCSTKVQPPEQRLLRASRIFSSWRIAQKHWVLKLLSTILSKVTNADAKWHYREKTKQATKPATKPATNQNLPKTTTTTTKPQSTHPRRMFCKIFIKMWKWMPIAWLLLVSSFISIINLRKFTSFPETLACFYGEILLYIWILWFFAIVEC